MLESFSISIDAKAGHWNECRGNALTATMLLLVVSPQALAQVAPGQSVLTDAQRVQALAAKNSKLTASLQDIYQQAVNAANSGTVQVFDAPNLAIRRGLVNVDMSARLDTRVLAAALRRLGAQGLSVFNRMVSGWVPVGKLKEISELSSLGVIRPVYVRLNTGSVTSQGDIAMRSNFGRVLEGVNGDGVTVGTISDSFDCLEQADADVASGDLPEGTVVLDDSVCPSGIDEGRAMMQIISDVAPGVRHAFHSGFNGQPAFANGILSLAENAGANIIVDDLVYLAEPYFQDGIIAQAVDAVSSQGISYFSAAGNEARSSYQSEFRSTDIGVIWGYDGNAHDFDPGDGIDVYQEITIPSRSSIAIGLQWDEPFTSVSGTGSATDIDIVLLNAARDTVLAGSLEDNIAGDPVELLFFFNESLTEETFNIVIEYYNFDNTSPPSLIKYIEFNGESYVNEYATDSSTIIGHNNSATGIAVGAVGFRNTPVYGVSPPLKQPYSSAGGTPILFDTDGNRISLERAKPNIMGPDGGNTTFFASDSDNDSDDYPNFFGTSAAAPHAAGVAALLLEQNPDRAPADIRERLQSTAVDMSVPGFDNDTGYGFIIAEDALNPDVNPDPFILSWAKELFNVDESAGTVRVRVDLNRVSESDVTFTMYTLDGTATRGPGNDYYGVSREFIVPAGDQSIVIPINVLSDDVVEDIESFSIVLTDARGADIDRSTSVVNIIDSDDPATTILVKDTEVSEGMEYGAIEIVLSAPTDQDVTGFVFTRGGTAEPGTDFYGVAQSIVIPAGAVKYVLPVQILNDAVVEEIESLSATLVGVDGATIVRDTGVISIKDND